MDLQSLLDAVGRAARMTRGDYHLTLGGLIAACEAADPKVAVKFDIGGSPNKPHSYREYYEDLSFEVGPDLTADKLLTIARECLGKSYVGYKGGSYKMDADTPLWCAFYGSAGSAIVGAEMRDGVLTLLTKIMP